MTPELRRAKDEGRAAGAIEAAAGLNPYAPGSLLAVTWETERLQTISARLIKTTALLAVVGCKRCQWTGLRCQLVDGACPDCSLDQ